MIIDVIKKSKLPKDFLELLPSTCEHCGGKLEISESLMRFGCNNQGCKGKAINKLSRLLNQIGVDYISLDECRIFIEKYNLSNHLAIFDYLPEVDGELIDGFGEYKSNKLYTDLVGYKKGIKLYEYISLAYLPNLEGYEKIIFSEYNNLDKFYDTLYTNQVNFIDTLLKGNSLEKNTDGVSIKAYNIYRELIDNEYFLKEYVKSFTFLSNRLTINIGVIGGIKDNKLREIEKEFSSEYIRFEFTTVPNIETAFILDLIGVKNEVGVDRLYKDTNMYKVSQELDLEIIRYDECVNKIRKVMKKMGIWEMNKKT